MAELPRRQFPDGRSRPWRKVYLPEHTVWWARARRSSAVESGSDGSWLWPAPGPEGGKWAEASFELTGSPSGAGAANTKVWGQVWGRSRKGCRRSRASRLGEGRGLCSSSGWQGLCRRG